MAGLSNLELIDAVDDVLLTTLSLVRDLSEDDADLPTECPGWTVRDQLAHMVGLEQVLNGAPQSDIELPPLDHVRNEIDEYMERQVHIRRQLPMAAIAGELAGLRKRRLSSLRRPAGEAALAYVRGRGLSDATIDAFAVGFAPASRTALCDAAAGVGGQSDRWLLTRSRS